MGSYNPDNFSMWQDVKDNVLERITRLKKRGYKIPNKEIKKILLKKYREVMTN